MYGNLFIYDSKWKLIAFESGSLSSSQCLVRIGGLADGLVSLPCVEKLSSKLESLSKPCLLIQPLFRSSNLQYDKKKHSKIARVILQGPVSDRQYLSRLSSTEDQLDYRLKNNNDIKEWLSRYLHDPPKTIQRYLSLNQINSIEDFF